jgi:hypothetical protein
VLQEAADELLGGKGAGSEIAGQGDRDQEVPHGQEHVLLLLQPLLGLVVLALGNGDSDKGFDK